MEELVALISTLDGLSLVIGAVIGLLAAIGYMALSSRTIGKRVEQALEKQQGEYEDLSKELKSTFSSLSQEALTSSQESFLTLANDKFADQTQRHTSELDGKKELIETQLQNISKELKTVPTELEKNQQHVSETLGKTTEQLKESNESYLNLITERAETQTKQHTKELETKKELIDQRLTNMDSKLGKVERLITDLQTDRKAQYGALDDQLKTLTQTTSHLQKALADNRARGQWGERMAEDMLNFMGLVEGVNYTKQSALDDGTRPDFTFRFPNQKSLNMDAKFPLDNYLRFVEADNDVERKEFSQKFLRDVNQRVNEIQKRGYIAAETLDCVLIFIPNEQVYRFIYEQDQRIIDEALKQRVIMCSPLTLYIVLAVIRQAAENFNIEQRSQEIVNVVNEIRTEWDKYTGQMDKLERRFKGMNDDFNVLTGTRTRQMDRKFVKIDSFTQDPTWQVRGENKPSLPKPKA